METLAVSSAVSSDIQTSCSNLVKKIWMLPTHLHHQAMSLLTYILHMYSLYTPKKPDSEVKRLVHVFESPAQKDVLKVRSQDNPDSTLSRRLFRTPVSKQGCTEQSCGNH